MQLTEQLNSLTQESFNNSTGQSFMLHRAESIKHYKANDNAEQSYSTNSSKGNKSTWVFNKGRNN